MYKNLEDNIKLPDLELGILKYWEKNGTFKKSISEKASKKEFTFYEGPPTANGVPGIHHVISRTVKDMICRYKTMSGYKVNRKAGWDTHGLPVEVEVEKKLGFRSKDDIKHFGATEFNNACRESIFTYLSEWENLTHRMGYWIDLKDAYVTFHNEYIESVWWALRRFFDGGLIYKGFKIQPFCPICESPLSSHEVAQGYQDIKDPSIYVKFKIKSEKFSDTDFLVWTTTPWTLLSNVALCVNPDEIYVVVNTQEHGKLVLAKARLRVLKEEYEIIREINGKELEFIEYSSLFELMNVDKKAYYVTCGDFVTMEDGTGIVHIAPAFGEDDYNIGLKYDLPMLQAVEKNGLFKKGFGRYENMNFKEADPEIINDLKISGRLYKKEMFTHSYPFCWRHKKPLIYYATDSWFIQTTKYKDKMISLNKEINWYPAEVGTGRFGNWLEENKDWALSRNRFWGTPLPIWSYDNEQGEIVYECIGSIEELRTKSLNFDDVYNEKKPLDLHLPFIDTLEVLSDTGKMMKREPVVIDCWFDSGSMPFAQYHYPFENKELFEHNYPADFIAEGLDQTRGWFYSLHAIGTFLFGKPAYKNLIVNGLILDKFGKKMSKSVGNVVDPFVMLDKFGADILRWYLVFSSPMGKSKLFNEDDLIEVKNKFFDTLINTYKFFVIYSNMIGFEYKEAHITPENDRADIDKWIISKLNSVKKDYFDLMDNYDITKASRILYDFTLDELSNWYIRRNRKRFRNPANNNDKLSAFCTLYEVLIEVLKLSAPLSPFLTEKLYLGLKNPESSIHLSEFTDSNSDLINEELQEEMDLAQKIVNLVRSVRVKNNLKVRQPLRQLIIPVLEKEQSSKILKVKDIILDEINVKELKLIEGDSNIIRKKAKPNFKVIGPKFGKDVKKIQSLINNLKHEDIKVIERNNKISIENFEISREDIDILTENIEGWLIESEGSITVALDTKLDKELIDEGIVREFVNRVQNYRKTNNFKVNDNIKILIRTTDKIEKILKSNFDSFSNEILCKELSINDNGKEYFKTDINGETCDFLIEKL
ncbi:MAG TPA: isoleucine--tRNA ligase [Ignavibacteria bacterium]